MANPIGSTERTNDILIKTYNLLKDTGIVISSEVEVKNDTGNPIPSNITQVASATVTAGAGAVAAGTQRITLASDDPAVVSLAVIDDWDSSDRCKVIEGPDATSTFCPSQDVSAALEASSVSKASAGVFYGLSGHNTLAAAQWILVYNAAAVPANGAITPIAAIRVGANSNFSFDTGKFGIYCSSGICWSNSTDATIFNKTLGAADCFVNLSYI